MVAIKYVFTCDVCGKQFEYKNPVTMRAETGIKPTTLELLIDNSDTAREKDERGICATACSHACVMAWLTDLVVKISKKVQ